MSVGLLSQLRVTGQPSIGFRSTIEGAKGLFFDRESVLQATTAAERKVLSRFGYFTMRDARQSIRKPPKKRRGKGSDAGKPPYNQTGLLKRFIYFAYAPEKHSVVIGPVQLDGRIRMLQIPRVLEEGGMTRLTFKVREPGQRRTKTVYGKSVRIDARPYMRPAYDRQLAKQMPDLWRNAIRSGRRA